MSETDVTRDEEYMRRALEEARRALNENEVPVGAVVVAPDGRVAGAGHDRRMALKDPTAHAEVFAIREAARDQGDWRLDGYDLYVTLEPCPMCAGAILQARVRRVVWGADSPKAGAVASRMRMLDVEGLNHRVEYTSGVLAEPCAAVLTEYFRKHRRRNADDEESG